jgi:hypothetical protein
MSKVCALGSTAKNRSGPPATLSGRFRYLVDAESWTNGAHGVLRRAFRENGNRSLSELNITREVIVPLVCVFEVSDTVEPTEAQLSGSGHSRFGIHVRLERRR